jgi:transposase
MKEPAVLTKKTRRKFDANFKREAVAMWQNSGKTAQEIAAQLGIRGGQLYEWKKSVMPTAAQGDLQTQNEALRKENALLRQQRDILKKTLGIISEPLKNATNGSKR